MFGVFIFKNNQWNLLATFTDYVPANTYMLEKISESVDTFQIFIKG